MEISTEWGLPKILNEFKIELNSAPWIRLVKRAQISVQ